MDGVALFLAKRTPNSLTPDNPFNSRGGIIRMQRVLNMANLFQK